MRKVSVYILSVFLLILVSCSDNSDPKPDFLSSGTFDGSYFPTNSWKYCSPEEVGVSESLFIKSYEPIFDKRI